MGEGYSTSAAHLGAILCGDMTTPAVFTKVSTMLAIHKEKEVIQRLITEDFRGEVTVREYSHKGKDGGAISFFESKLHRYLKTETEISSVLDTLLYYIMIDAVKWNRVMLIEELIKYDKNLCSGETYEGFTIFHGLAINYHKKVLSLLVNKPEVKELLTTHINKKNCYGYAPLDYGIKLRCSALIEDLIRFGAIYDAENISTKTSADILE